MAPKSVKGQRLSLHLHLKPLLYRNNRISKKKVRKTAKKVKKQLNTSSDSKSFDAKELMYNEGDHDLESEEEELCIICGDFRKRKMWYRCTACGKWVHKECSGFCNKKIVYLRLVNSFVRNP